MSQLPVKSVYKIGKSTENLKVEFEVQNSDRYGNPIYIIQKDLKKRVILWGYDGKYPIAQIENASYEEVKSALKENPEELSSSKEPDFTTIKTLITKLPNAIITICEYEPYIGLRLRIDANGIITYYDYDDAGRLLEVYNLENGFKQILQANKYHYRGMR